MARTFPNVMKNMNPQFPKTQQNLAQETRYVALKTLGNGCQENSLKTSRGEKEALCIQEQRNGRLVKWKQCMQGDDGATSLKFWKKKSCWPGFFISKNVVWKQRWNKDYFPTQGAKRISQQQIYENRESTSSGQKEDGARNDNYVSNPKNICRII